MCIGFQTDWDGLKRQLQILRIQEKLWKNGYHGMFIGSFVMI